MRTLSHATSFCCRIALCLSLCLLSSLSLAPAVAAAQQTDRMEALIRPRVDDKTFMGTVLVARGDEVLLSKGYGFANLEWNIPNTRGGRETRAARQ